jgi:hypothetical protein
MNKRTLLAVSSVLLFAACVKEVSSDERLERETRHEDSTKTDSAAELSKLKCDDAQADLAKARDSNRTEDERLSTYVDLFGKLKTRTSKFEEAMSRNPDLAYQEGSQDLVNAREQCSQSMADVRLEAETMIREIMQMLVVDDVRGAQPIKVARTNFETLKSAIDKLEMDDRDALFSKIANAEKQVEVKSEPRKRNK